ncbi:hypothetical protein CsSME_00050652 [Camellia sinensis var. sinensis]
MKIGEWLKLKTNQKIRLDISTQRSEVPSNVIDHTEQFTLEGVFNSKDQLVTWARDVGHRTMIGFIFVVRSMAKPVQISAIVLLR